MEVEVAVDEEKKKRRRIIDVNLIYELLDTVDILILPRPSLSSSPQLSGRKEIRQEQHQLTLQF